MRHGSFDTDPVKARKPKHSYFPTYTTLEIALLTAAPGGTVLVHTQFNQLSLRRREMRTVLKVATTICPVCLEESIHPGEEMCEECTASTEQMLADKALFYAQFGLYQSPDETEEAEMALIGSLEKDYLAYRDIANDRDEADYRWH